MRKLFLIFFLLIHIGAIAQEMRFVIEEKCSADGNSLLFECTKIQTEFTIIKNGKRFIGVNSVNGTTYQLKVLEADNLITVLQNPVFFSGTSTIHLTSKDKNFYWVEVAYSTTLKKREITIRSGRKIN